LTTDLNLTPDQVNKIQNAFSSFKEKRKEIKSSGGDRTQIQNARKQMTEEITGYLNEQQRQTFAANASKYDSILHGGQE